ncbi:ATP synthase subunit O, mitochondrial [Physcomitrium patens]|uniref:ATP synthase subunit O, mitochondrial n=1 Tax=Physcomitrium patens TaxID=3218 RepID=A0A2K1JUX7_PHYPA|nr:ATP synthase subunit O, mitochondrial-like [Physcomitrium patens]PNR45337.1 hypothetical protein PHYPA_015108 [Physcomitrium patens]|eukprot:XP_024388348.1 ATP synthase subunit O, mitochondrial-like [Physcomitrella patens]
MRKAMPIFGRLCWLAERKIRLPAVPLGLRGMAKDNKTWGGDACESGGAGKEKHIEVLLPMFGVAGKYASALYVVAVRGKALDTIKADLMQVTGVAGMPGTLFAEFMKDPSISKASRVATVEAVFKATNFHGVTKNFMNLLAENGRLNWVPKIFKCYNELLNAHKGKVEVYVTTAMELSETDLEEIKKAMKGNVEKGQNVEITQRVDRSIIGGIVVAIGDKHIDLSIARKITQMEKVLAQAI